MGGCEIDKDWYYLSLLLIGACTPCVLTVKKQLEYPQRDVDIWCLDCSKQLVGLALSFVIDGFVFGHAVSEKYADEEDVCERFFIDNFYVTILGAIFNITVLVSLKLTVIKYYPSETNKAIVNFGCYGEPFSWVLYIIQLSIWVSTVLSGKVVTILLILLINPSKGPIFRAFFTVLASSSLMKHIVIIFVVPVVLTCGVVWVQDVFLKHDRGEEESRSYLVNSVLDHSKVMNCCVLGLTSPPLQLIHLFDCNVVLFIRVQTLKQSLLRSNSAESKSLLRDNSENNFANNREENIELL